MKRKILLTLGSYSNLEIESEVKLTNDEWLEISEIMNASKKLLDTYMPGASTDEKLISKKQINLIVDKGTANESVAETIKEYTASLNKTTIKELTLSEASTLIDIILAMEEDASTPENPTIENEVSEKIDATVSVTPEKHTDEPQNLVISDNVYPDYVIEQMPDKCKFCGQNQITIKTGNKNGRQWYAYACGNEACNAKLVFANENKVKTQPSQQQITEPPQQPTGQTETSPIKDDKNPAPPKITSNGDIPEWAIAEFTKIHGTEIMGRSFRYEQKDKGNGMKYMFKSDDKLGGWNGIYFVTPPVNNPKSNLKSQYTL